MRKIRDSLIDEERKRDKKTDQKIEKIERRQKVIKKKANKNKEKKKRIKTRTKINRQTQRKRDIFSVKEGRNVDKSVQKRQKKEASSFFSQT